MTNVTNTFASLNTFKSHVQDDVKSIVSNYADDELSNMDASDIVNELQDASYTPEVIYYADAWEIVAGSSFNDYEAEDLDFSNCSNSLECLMQEANSVIYTAYSSVAYEIAEILIEEATERHDASQD
mgnify:FL=1